VTLCSVCSVMMEIYSLDKWTETSERLLASIADDTDTYLQKMPNNCRNISDEVYPGIHVGDQSAARNTFYLKKVGVSHVLNTAEGQTSGTVDTNQKFYKPFNINYKGLKLLDVSQANISIHFTEISDFIDEGLSSGGKVLVNCQKGVSRSSAAVLAYLMLRHNMTAVDALIEVRKQRDVRPNDGFLRQLADLDNKLRRERGLLKE